MGGAKRATSPAETPGNPGEAPSLSALPGVLGGGSGWLGRASGEHSVVFPVSNLRNLSALIKTLQTEQRRTEFPKCT